MKKLEKYIDHTLLKPTAGIADIQKLCEEAKEHGFYAVCVNSRFVPVAREALEGSDVKIASVIGFPLGAMSTEAKVFETENACQNGAAEIDMVLEYGLLKEGHKQAVFDDVKAVVDAAAKYGSIVKVILETGALTDGEIVDACKLSEEAGAAFVKTSTGFGAGGATVHAVELMRASVGPNVQVKASGGIRDRETALAMIKAGADRIGASAGIEICKAAEGEDSPFEEGPKNILVLMGSPKMSGNTAALADAFCRGAEAAGHKVHVFNVANMNIHPCTDCRYCSEHGGACVYQDDMQQILSHLYTDDVIVFATPVYFYGFTAQLKTALDRMICVRTSAMTVKGSILLSPYGDTDTTVPVPMVDMYKAFTGYIGWENLGVVTAENCMDPGDIQGHKALVKAERLGRTL
ncbi:MAG: deoxyribose-phosphate aldolase [Clostridia bacterium]|nr:deoxyribose-phosphate aldolase [Clostridia bacterium]